MEEETSIQAINQQHVTNPVLTERRKQRQLQAQMEKQSPMKKDKVKEIQAASKANKQIPLKGIPVGQELDAVKCITNFNSVVERINEYINLTLKNKNSLVPAQGKRFLKLV